MTPKSKKIALAATLATAIAIPAEGLRQRAYLDPVNVPTICFGSTKGVKLGDYKTVEECKALLTQEMLHSITTTDSCVPNAPIPVLAAFSDAVFNMGPTIACDTSKSTAAKFLKAGNWEAACRELPKWNKARIAGVLTELPGLTKRRVEEMKLCLQYPLYLPQQ